MFAFSTISLSAGAAICSSTTAIRDLRLSRPTLPIRAPSMRRARTPNAFSILQRAPTLFRRFQQPEDYFRANVDGTFAVLEAVRRHGAKRLVYVASSSCYGVPATYPTPETAPPDCRYPYALTKYLGEQMVMHWAQVYRLPAVSVRFFNVYGPRARTSGTYGAVFGVFLAQLLAGEPLTIVGDGEQTRDFTFVRDVVDALLTVAASDKIGEIYNVGSGKPVSVK